MNETGLNLKVSKISLPSRRSEVAGGALAGV